MKAKILFVTIAAVLSAGCRPPVPDISIYDAAEDGDIEVVKQHLVAGTDINSKDNEGWTPLHEAASEGHEKIVELLIAKGADLNAKDDEGDTPLDAANDGGHPEIMNLLVKHGATSRDQ